MHLQHLTNTANGIARRLAIALGIFVLSGAGILWAADDELVIGVFPRRPALETQQMFTPLSHHLGEQLGMPTRLVTPPDFPSFWRALQAGEFDLVHFNQYHYVRSQKELGYRAIVTNEEQGRGTTQSALWVRKDSGINKPEDLKHRKIIFGGGHKAMVSYIMATDLLRKEGLKDSDYISQFTINPIHAMKAVFHRQGAAAGLNYNADKQEGLRKKVNFDEMERLLVSEPVAHHPWALNPKVSDALGQRIRDILVNIKDIDGGDEILHKAGLTGLLPASDKDYEPHRVIIFNVHKEEY